MAVEKNQILAYGDYELFVLEYLPYRGKNYILAAELNAAKDNIDEHFVVLEEVSDTDKVYVKQVMDKEVLRCISPIFEHHVKLTAEEVI